MSNNSKGDKLSAIVLLSGVGLSTIAMLLGAKIDNQVITIVGVLLFIAAVMAGIFIGNGSGVGKASREMRSNTNKYEPLLLDERTKQHPEVQRLLQYTSVQKVFFDPSFFKTAEAQNDPNVRELLAVFDGILSDGAVYGGLNNANSGLLSRDELMRREKAKNRPRRIVGAIFGFAGLALFMVPFFIAFVASSNGSEVGGEMASLIFTAAPLGMVLIVIGSIVSRNMRK